MVSFCNCTEYKIFRKISNQQIQLFSQITDFYRQKYNSSMQLLTFKDRLQLYKTAKKPRKQIRLKLEMITNGLNLPKISKCENKVNQVFKVLQINKIEPQIYQYANRQNEHRSKQLSKMVNEDLRQIRYQNKVQSLKVNNYLFNQRLKLNEMLQQIHKTVDARSLNIINDCKRQEGANCENICH